MNHEEKVRLRESMLEENARMSAELMRAKELCNEKAIEDEVCNPNICGNKETQNPCAIENCARDESREAGLSEMGRYTCEQVNTAVEIRQRVATTGDAAKAKQERDSARVEAARAEELKHRQLETQRQEMRETEQFNDQKQAKEARDRMAAEDPVILADLSVASPGATHEQFIEHVDGTSQAVTEGLEQSSPVLKRLNDMVARDQEEMKDQEFKFRLQEMKPEQLDVDLMMMAATHATNDENEIYNQLEHSKQALQELDPMFKKHQSDMTTNIREGFQNSLNDIVINLSKLNGLDHVHVDISPLKELQTQLEDADNRHSAQSEYDHEVTMQSLKDMERLNHEIHDIYASINKHLASLAEAADAEAAGKETETLLQQVSQQARMRMYQAMGIATLAIAAYSATHH